MHELSLCRSIAGIATRAADGRRVERVQLDVGHLRQVVPETLVYCWGVVCEQTPQLAGSRLDVTSIPAVLDCRRCGAETTLTGLPIIVCSACGTNDVAVRSGEEFLVRSMDVATTEGYDRDG